MCGGILVVNSSLRKEVVPQPLKEILVQPLLKKLSLDLTILDNFHSVTNIISLGKIVEAVVVQQLQKILDEANHLKFFQSDLRFGYRIETALLTFSDDLWHEQDGSSASIFVLVDHLAAFGTINHGILQDQFWGLWVDEWHYVVMVLLSPHTLLIRSERCHRIWCFLCSCLTAT